MYITSLYSIIVFYYYNCHVHYIIVFYYYRIGDITKLSLEAVVHPTNESLTDKNPISNCILEAAGPELKDELKTQVVCKLHCHCVIDSCCIVLVY